VDDDKRLSGPKKWRDGKCLNAEDRRKFPQMAHNHFNPDFATRIMSAEEMNASGMLIS
jgi:hypothetical protein